MNHTACFEEFSPRCSFPKYVAPNDAIAGLGVLISFVVLSAICILGTIFALIRRVTILRAWDSDTPMEERKRHDPTKVTTLSLITILSGDILLVANIAISLSALILQSKDEIIVYHYNIVCNLAIAATFASLTTTIALPLFAADRWTSTVRILLYLASIILLAVLLGLRSPAGHFYPGRAPSNGTQKMSALVLEVSCFLRHQYPTKCAFDTDRKAIPALSDAWALMILAFITTVAIAAQTVQKKANPRMMRDPTSASEASKALDSIQHVFFEERFPWELLVILISITWTSVALWQAFSLRKWMNSSGWFDNPAELVVDSFGQLVPIFQTLTLFLIVAVALDAKRLRDKTAEAKRN